MSNHPGSARSPESPAESPPGSATPFGQCALGEVRRLTIGEAPGPVLEVLDLGATVHRLWITGGDGVRRNVVLGHAEPQEYLVSRDYVGGTIGRYANRIAGGRFPLDDQVVTVAANERGNTLHGGPEGFDKRIWEVAEHDRSRLLLRLVSPDGDQGFPGELTATALLEIRDDDVALTFEATTDASTVACLTTHAYVDLDGTGSIAGQTLRVGAEEYLPVDGSGLPLQVAPVAGTAYDLRTGVDLGDVLARGGLDHSYLPPGEGLRPVATLDSPETRTRMVLLTDQPALQVYTGGGFDGSRRSTTGVAYGPGAGVALEPQLPPDTPNRPDLGSAVLRSGEIWRSRSVLRFGPLG